MTLFYPHVPKIFTRDLLSCVVCLILCNNSIVLFNCFIVLDAHSGFVNFIMFLLFYMFFHICVCHVSINITDLLTYFIVVLLVLLILGSFVVATFSVICFASFVFINGHILV